jgi:hypothetical protein
MMSTGMGIVPSVFCTERVPEKCCNQQELQFIVPVEKVRPTTKNVTFVFQ